MGEGAHKPGGILTLDLATRSGWAYGLLGAEKPVSGWHQLPKGVSDGAFFVAYDRWLKDQLGVLQPRTVCWEAPFIRGVSNVQTAKRLMGLSAVTDLIVTGAELKAHELNNATVKKYFTGNGRAQKKDVILRCNARGIEVTDDNQADAIACWFYADDMLRQWRAA